MDKIIGRNSSDNRSSALIDGGLRHSADIEPVGQVGEFHSFNSLRHDERAFHRHLVSEHHGSRAVWSGGSDKNLKVNRIGQGFQEITCVFVQS